MSIESEIKRAITLGYDIEIRYEKYGGEVSQRKVSNISYNNEFGDFGYSNAHIKGFCHLRNEERTFRISRITAVRVIPAGTWVSLHSSLVDRKPYTEINDSRSLVHSTPVNRSYSYSSNIPSHQTHHEGGSSNEGCYIATMAYGSYNHPQVIILRWYRDNILKRKSWGRLFIRVYYQISPKLVVVLKGHNVINKLIRIILDKQVQRIIEKKTDP